MLARFPSLFPIARPAELPTARHIRLSRFTITLVPAIYLAIHFILRLLESTSLRWDESEQTLFSQQLALGYNDQPPVYTWLLWSMFRLTGVSLVGVYLLKLLILAAIYAGLFAVGRRITSDRFAILAAASLLLTPYFAWSLHRRGPHSPRHCFCSHRIPAYPSTSRTADNSRLRISRRCPWLSDSWQSTASQLLAISLLMAMITVPAYRRRLSTRECC